MALAVPLRENRGISRCLYSQYFGGSLKLVLLRPVKVSGCAMVEKNGFVSCFNPSTHDGAMFKIVKFSKIKYWVKLKNKEHHSKILLNNFPMNGHTLEFCP